MDRANVFNIQRYCLHDGPGIRSTVFFKGCPLDCQWCHNPESIEMYPQLSYNNNKCLACGRCITLCPTDALYMNEDNKISITQGLCVDCLVCTDACPTRSIELIGRYYTLDDLLSIVLKDRLIFEESGGGVTMSGGEPLSQPRILLSFLQALKKEYIHTVIDTSGYAPRSVFEAVAQWTDLFLYDLKIIDRDKSLRYTGMDSDLVMNNLRYLKELGKDVLIRSPLIPSVNDSIEDLELLGKSIGDAGFNKVEIMPYHRLGANKKEKLATQQSAVLFDPPTEDMLNTAVECLTKFNLDVEIGGVVYGTTRFK